MLMIINPYSSAMLTASYHKLNSNMFCWGNVAHLTIKRASSSSGTGSRSGTEKDSGNWAPLARASAALMVVEKHSSQAHSVGFQAEGSGRQFWWCGGTGGLHKSWSRCRPTASEAKHCMYGLWTSWSPHTTWGYGGGAVGERNWTHEVRNVY